MIRYFVTSTGTEIGKTHVTAALAYLARMRGLSLRVAKPVVSGIDAETLGVSDPAGRGGRPRAR